MDFGFCHWHSELNKNKLLPQLSMSTQKGNLAVPLEKIGDKALPLSESWHVSRLAREVFSCFLHLQVNNTGEHFQALRNTSVWVRSPHRDRPRPARRSRGCLDEASPGVGAAPGGAPAGRRSPLRAFSPGML